MKREDLLKSREYWISKIQIDLFNLIETYRKNKGYTKTQLASELNVTKGYITQILNGDFDHKISKLIDLSLAFGKVPEINFTSIQNYIAKDAKSDFLEAKVITLSAKNIIPKNDLINYEPNERDLIANY